MLVMDVIKRILVHNIWQSDFLKIEIIFFVNLLDKGLLN